MRTMIGKDEKNRYVGILTDTGHMLAGGMLFTGDYIIGDTIWLGTGTFGNDDVIDVKFFRKDEVFISSKLDWETLLKGNK